MANNKEEAGKGTPRPGDMPAARRPYATIDVKATEVESREPPPGAASSARPAASAGGDAAKSEAKPAGGQGKPAGAAGASATAAKPRPLFASLGTRRGATRLLTHLSAGAVGALIVLAAAQLMTPDRTPASAPEMGDVMRRLADLENVLGSRPNAGMRARVEELGRSLGVLGETQAKLARDTKALESKVGSSREIPQELVSRLTRLEDMLSTLPAAGPSGQSPQAAALASRLAELQKATRDADETAKAGVARFEGELSAVRVEAGRLAQRLDGLRGEIDERLKGAAKAADLRPLADKVTALERDMQGFVKGETERTVNTSRVVLTLELANLKRAIDRGGRFADELARVKAAGSSLNLKPLERYALDGVPTVADLTRSFRPAANAMLDAEAERADATLVDRLLSGARSIVRIRKAGHAADDTSLEATVGRMEAALKEGRLNEVLANAKKLPPKAALAGEDWIKKVEARQSVELALSDVEGALKTSLGSGRADSGSQR
jgi:hypothetical protein